MENIGTGSQIVGQCQAVKYLKIWFAALNYLRRRFIISTSVICADGIVLCILRVQLVLNNVIGHRAPTLKLA